MANFVIQFWSGVRPLWRYLGKLYRYQPITIRGVTAAFLSVVAIRAFGVPEYDLVAYIVGGGVFGLVVVALVASIVQRFWLLRKLSAGTFLDLSGNQSGQPVNSSISLENASLLPFFTLEVIRNFDHPGAIFPHHILRGNNRQWRLVDTVTFPHRGVWRLNSLDYALRDALGFTAFRGSIPLEASVEVSAPEIPIRPLPVVTASARAGDQLQHSEERSGDLFDMKAYDPSDGVKRILWKTYARSGQLYVRRPEPAVIPEGEVALYLVANKNEDHVAGALRSYIQELYNAQIAVLFGTDGLSTPLDTPEGQLAHTEIVTTGVRNIEKRMNYSVWDSQAGSGEGLGVFLEELMSQKRVLQRVIVFAPQERLDWLETVMAQAGSLNVAVSTALASNSLCQQRNLSQQATSLKDVLLSAVSLKGNNERSSSSFAYTEGLASSGAEVLICEHQEAL